MAVVSVTSCPEEGSFNRQEYLSRVYRLDKVVRYFASDSLIHDIFLFALVIIITGTCGADCFMSISVSKAGKAGHVLVKNNQVERMLPDQLKRVAAIIDSGYIITLAFLEKYMWLQKVNLVVSPKYGVWHIYSDCIEDSESVAGSAGCGNVSYDSS